MMAEADPNNFMTYSREDSYQRSFCRRSCVVRPMPRGIKVYFVLLQFILYEITSYSTELYLADRFSAFLVAQRYRKQYMDPDDEVVPEEVPAVFLVLRSLHLIFCLPMGFLADKYFGRTKVVTWSWMLLFITECLFTIHATLFEVSEYIDNASYIAITVSIIVAHAAGLAGVHVNLISCGVDQLVGAFADELSSYFHWYYWCRSAGVFIVCSFGTYIVAFKYSGYVLLMATVACTIAVVTNLVGTRWFNRADKVGNPLWLIYRVLRYASVAKPPGQRSAFSYDDRTEPSRIDLVKETHHGQIKDEKVEDVKIFLRILGILFSLIGFFCVYFLLYSVYLKQAMHLNFVSAEGYVHKQQITNCHNLHTNTTDSYSILLTCIHISPQWCLSISTLTVMIAIPLLDRLFYPTAFCQWTATMFSRITAGMCFSMLSILCALSLEVWRYTAERESVLEVNTLPEFSGPPVAGNPSLYFIASNISIFAIIPQFVVEGISEAFALVTVVEFIYAQSPGYMKGLLMGCLFFTEGFAMLLGALLFVILAAFHTNSFRTFNSCYTGDPCDCVDDKKFNGFSIGLYSVIVIIGLASFIMFRCVVHRYKVRKRERDLVYFTNV